MHIPPCLCIYNCYCWGVRIYIHEHLHTNIHIDRSTYVHAQKPTYLPTFLRSLLPTYLHTSTYLLPTDLRVWTSAHTHIVRTSMDTSMHACSRVLRYLHSRWHVFFQYQYTCRHPWKKPSAPRTWEIWGTLKDCSACGSWWKSWQNYGPKMQYTPSL